MVLILAVACAPIDQGKLPADTEPIADADTDADADADTDEDTDTETHFGGGDTGYWKYFTGDLEIEDGSFASGHAGALAATDDPQARELGDPVLCEALGTLGYVGPAPPGCPDCLWSFDLGPIEEYAPVAGDYCDWFRLGAAGAFDGAFDYAWGFAPTYTYTYAGTDYIFADALMLAGDDGEWFLFAYNYADSVHVAGDPASSVLFERPWFTYWEWYQYP
jgi:hypothetical protein